MLDCPELDMEISDASMETTEFNDYREMSRKDRNANDVLAMTWEEVRFFCKMNRSLLTHLPSQSVDCVRWVSYIQGPKSRKNQAE